MMRNSFFIPSMVYSCFERNVALYCYYVLKIEIPCTVTIVSASFRSFLIMRTLVHNTKLQILYLQI